MKFTKKTMAIMVPAAILLASCGGGSSTTTPISANKSTFNLTGTVPGTLIEAFCDDGSYYKTNSVTNATNQHPFTLTLPTGLACRVVMTTNETDPNNKVVTPVRLVNTQGTGGIAFEGTNDVDLNHVDLALDRTGMQKDDNQDGVEDNPKNVSLDPTASSNIQIVTAGNDPLDRDGDGIINVYEDDDGDGVNNKDDTDDDGDGIEDSRDPDKDGDGIDENDFDGDGVVNGRDVDDDNDSINDVDDSDDDNDGVDDVNDTDDDNDGIDDSNDKDQTNDNDRDGIQNGFDPDDDNDGINDTEDPDDDGDGINDVDDPDDDNDGIDDDNDRD